MSFPSCGLQGKDRISSGNSSWVNDRCSWKEPFIRCFWFNSQTTKEVCAKIGLAPAASIIREWLSRNWKMVGVTRLNPPQSIHKASGDWSNLWRRSALFTLSAKYPAFSLRGAEIWNMCAFIALSQSIQRAYPIIDSAKAALGRFLSQSWIRAYYLNHERRFFSLSIQFQLHAHLWNQANKAKNRAWSPLAWESSEVET